MSSKMAECSQCGEKAGFRCTTCKMTAYCSKVCYAIHYKASHKALCKRRSKAMGDMMSAVMAESTMRWLPPEVTAVTLVSGSHLSVMETTYEYMLICGEMNTPVSITTAVRTGQEMLKNRSTKRLNSVNSIMPWLCLLHPHPDIVKICCDAIGTDPLLGKAEVLKPVPTEDATRGSHHRSFADTLFLALPHLIVKCLLMVEAGGLLDRLDALLISKTSAWKDPVVVTNLLPFLWPEHHCLERAALAAQAGRKGFGTVGDLRAAHAHLLDQVHFLSRMLVGEQGQALLSLLLSEQAPTHFEGKPVKLGCHAAPGSMREMYAVAKMYHAVLHNKRVPLMAQVRKALAVYLVQPRGEPA